MQDIKNKKNREIWKRFHTFLKAQGYSYRRISKYYLLIRYLDSFLNKPLDKVERQDIERFLSDFVSKRYDSVETRNTFRRMLKRFYKWLLGNDEEHPDVVKWIKNEAEIKKKLPDDMLTEEEIKCMIDHAKHERDKALVITLYESGARIGEFLNMKIKDVVFDEYGCKVRLFGKTGDRVIRLIFSTPYLRAWINRHPFKNDPNAPLWCGFIHPQKKPLSWNEVYMLLKDIGKRARIKKPLNPHNFRHSRATALANKLTEAQMNAYFGWSQDSKMSKIYIHLSGRDVDNAILNAYGLIKQEDNGSPLEVKECLRCKHKNEATALYCERCGMPLTITEKEYKAMMLKDMLLSREDIKNIVERSLFEILKQIINENDEARKIFEQFKA